MPAVALTDHGRCGQLLKFHKACVKEGVKPILGCEFYIAPKEHTLKEQIEGYRHYYHLPILAKTDKGRQNLFQLSSIAWKEGFYYKPRISIELLKQYKEDLIVLSGCAIGYISNTLMNDQVEKAYQHANLLREIIKDDFYIEVQNHGMEWQLPLRDKLFKLSQDLDIPIVATQDAHYQSQEDSVLHSHICKLSAGDLQFGTDQTYFKTYEELCQMFTEEQRHAIDRTLEVAEKCDGEWKYGKTIWPVVDTPEGITTEEFFEQKTWDGFKKRFREGTKEYQDRLSFEINIIKRMGFPNYFLVVADYIEWAKQSNILVGPGRGSGAGSLVAYCLEITNIDPIKYGLFFERFLNPDRVSNPDFDVDYADSRRAEVMQYMYDKYGEDKVAQIGTYGVFKPRGSLRDFARVTGEEYSVGEELAKRVPPDSAGFSMKWDEILKEDPGFKNTQWPLVVDLAIAAEGMKKQAGVHAAGLVVSNDSIAKTTPLFLGKGKEIATEFDMNDVEDVGLVKYDFLGLRNLTVLADTKRLIKDRQGVDINLDAIEEKDGDLDVYKSIFWQGDLNGVFQFETSDGFKDLCMKVKPTCIEDLSAITALFRPGPLSTGQTGEYAKRRAGESFEYEHPILEPILKETCGILCFQEQIMRLCVDMAGYSLAEADNMRRIIGKKKLDQIPVEKKRFISKSIENNIGKDIAESIWNSIEGFAKYCFNKSHSVAYSVISYQTAWLKYYYPIEFYAALLNSSLDNQDRMIKYVYSAKKKDIYISAPDINLSNTDFYIQNDSIIFPLSGIKGVGESAVKSILEHRPDTGYKSIHELIRAKVKKNIIKPLIHSGALDNILEVPRNQALSNLDILSEHYKQLDKWEEKVEKYRKRQIEIRVAKDMGSKKKLRKLKDPGERPEIPELEPVPSLSTQDRLMMERESLGFYISGHPLDEYSHISTKYKIASIKSEMASDKESFSIPIIVSKITEKRTRKGKNMAAVLIEDETGRVETVIFPKQWSYLKGSVEEGVVYLANIKAEKQSVADQETGEMNTVLKLMANSFNKLEYIEIPKTINVLLTEDIEIIFLLGDNVDVNDIQETRRIINEVLKQ
jgi:DNA polymerase-3 subunit alpha